jgi:phage gp29-like protein
MLALPAPDGALMLTRSGQSEDRRDGPATAPPQEDHKDLPVSTLAHWSVPQIRGALDQHHLGNFQAASMLIESTLGDGRVQTALNGRLKGITMRHPHVDPSPEDEGGRYAELCKRLWGDILHDELLDQVWTWCVMSGWSLCEIRWEMRRIGGLPGWAPRDLWFPVLVPWHQFFTWYHIVDRAYMAVTEDGVIPVTHGDPKWWLMTPWGEYRGWLRGAVRSVAPNWAVRQYALRDWARFSETHGLPLKVLRPPAQSNAGDKQRMLNQVSTMGTATTIMLPQQTGPDGASWLLELLEAKDRAWEAFPGLLDHCDREIQQVIRGTNLTSEVQGGSYAAAQVHADEDSGYADSDARKLCASVTHVFRLFLRYNFGEEAEFLCPRFRLEPPDKADVMALAQSQQFALTMAKQAKELGWELDAAKLCERYAIPLIGVNDTAATDADDND